MKWEKPSYIEINMSAEIGGYQEDNSEEPIPVSMEGLEQTTWRPGINEAAAERTENP